MQRSGPRHAEIQRRRQLGLFERTCFGRQIFSGIDPRLSGEQSVRKSRRYFKFLPFPVVCFLHSVGARSPTASEVPLFGVPVLTFKASHSDWPAAFSGPRYRCRLLPAVRSIGWTVPHAAAVRGGGRITPSRAERRRQTTCLKASGAKLAIIEFDTRHRKIFPTKMSMTRAA